jgi:hypothetical protein
MESSTSSSWYTPAKPQAADNYDHKLQSMIQELFKSRQKAS